MDEEELVKMIFPLLLCAVAGAILLKKYWSWLHQMSVVKKRGHLFAE
ncbi:hypothetical protein ACTHQ8_15435 [Lysinibacillus odysseyi]|nr:hypothetical protein [Lysinibacillus odysseyi]